MIAVDAINLCRMRSGARVGGLFQLPDSSEVVACIHRIEVLDVLKRLLIS